MEQTVQDVVVKETTEYSNGQTDGTSKYVMSGNDGKKTYFAKDGRIVGIVDRYGNAIKFEYASYTYKIDGVTLTRNHLSKITDSIGRVVTIEYKEDQSFTVGPISNTVYGADESYKTSQNPNTTNSGDLNGKFQVIVHLPGDKSLVYDKTAALVSSSKHVIRTRLQRVYDVDGKPKYHYWYEQPELGFTYMNGAKYSVYNRYEYLTQINYVKTNRIQRYVYNTYTQGLNSKGSMQYRKVFQKKELVKSGYSTSQSSFMDRFVTTEAEKYHYAYTNEADGYGAVGYKDDDDYLLGTYRYYTEVTDGLGNKTKYTYDGVHQLLTTELSGANHKEVMTTERDEMKLVKKQQTLLYQVKDGLTVGDPAKRIENFRYDQYGNLTNYTGPEAERNESGEPLSNEHMVIYAYAYDKYHVLSQKTWKQDKDTTSQILYEIDAKGNATKETRGKQGLAEGTVTTSYQYDAYGNITSKEAKSGDGSFVTYYDYSKDFNGVNLNGAYLAKEYSLLNGTEIGKRYAYDFNTGNLIAEMDANGNKTTYKYDALSRVIQISQPDQSLKDYEYVESAYDNFIIKYTDPNRQLIRNEYDTLGRLVKEQLWDNKQWVRLNTIEYDAIGNKTKEIDANGHSVRYGYDSKGRLVSKSSYENDKLLKGKIVLSYSVDEDAELPLSITITDEEGFAKIYRYDTLENLREMEETPDRSTSFKTTYSYDYVGNIVSLTNALAQTTNFEYDELNRLISRQDASGNETKMTYNALNQPLLQTDPGDRIIRKEYDASGRLAATKQYYSDTSGSYTYTQYGYDAANNVISQKQGREADGQDAVSAATSYTYDALNRVTDEYQTIDASRKSHTRYDYDRNSNRIKEVLYADAGETKYRLYEYAYNGQNLVTEEKGGYYEPNNVIQSFYQKLYNRDYAGNITNQQIDNGSGYDNVQVKYDYRNQPTEKSEPYTDGKTKTTRYSYDKTGRKITESITVQGNALSVSYGYDGMGRLLSVTDPLGFTTRYAYDANGNKTKEVDARYGAQALGVAPGIEYEYDKSNRLVRTSLFDGSTREVIQFFVYDGRGNVVKEVDGEGYNAAEPQSSYGTAYTYDENDRKITEISAQTAADNAKNGSSTMSKTYAYDGSGNLIRITDGLNRVTQTAYYGTGWLKETTYSDGNKDSYNYDLSGKGWITLKDRSGREIKTYFNVFDKPYRIEYPDGSALSYTYSAKGEQTAYTDQAGAVSYSRYNSDGTLAELKQWIRQGGDYAYYKVTRYQYDEATRLLTSETLLLKQPLQAALTEVYESAGDKTVNEYDKAGRLVRTSDSSGKEIVASYDRAGNTIVRKQKVEGDDYDVVRYEYDLLNRVTSESLLVRTSELSIDHLTNAKYDSTYMDRVLATSEFRYQRNGELKSKTDPNGHRTAFEYDLDRRLVAQTDPMGASVRYQYDAAGNLIRETNGIGAVTAYDYDGLNRLIRKKAPSASRETAITRYILDAAGNVAKEISPNQYEASKDTAELAATMEGISYKYDKMNRLVQTFSPTGELLTYTVYTEKGQIAKQIDGLRYTGDIALSAGEAYVYDGLGNVIAKTNPLGEKSSYVYDVLGQITKQTDERGHSTAYTYNADGTVSQILYPDGGSIRYTYDKLGRKTSETNELGYTTEFQYDAYQQVKIE